MTEQNVAILETSGISKTNAEEYGKLYKKILSSINNSKSSEVEIVGIVNKWSATQPKEFLNLLNLNTETGKEKFANAMFKSFNESWMKYFISYDPAPALTKTQAKVLALNGSKDIQVLGASNLEGIKKAMEKGNKNITIINIPGLNHLFQKCNLCTVNEYGELEETMSPTALEAISNWLEKEKIISK